MSTVKLPGGETIWYKKTGSGAPLIHIHGSAYGHRNFEKLTPLVSAAFEVIDFDLPGYGESLPGAVKPTDMEGIAEQVYQFIKALGYDKVNLHGTSFGAMIGLTLAALHPEVIDKLVLSCFLARYDNAARMMRATWKRAAKDSGMDAVADLTSVAGFARGFYDRPEAQAQLQSMRDAFLKTTPAAFIAGTETIERTDLEKHVANIKATTLLLAGEEDNMCAFKPADSGVGMYQIKQILPSAELISVPESGHYLVVEQPAATSRHIIDFLKK